MSADSISFPHLGILLRHVGRSVRIFGTDIAFYGIVIAVGMVAGIYLAMWIARKTGQDPDLYFNFALAAIVLSILGARVYYVVFSWDYYGAHPMEILNIRGGGLAIYGGVITGILTAVCFCYLKKIDLLLFLDTAIPALLLGQIIGRWGNFFNREAFGEYTDSFFAMRLPLSSVNGADVTSKMLDHTVTVDDIVCIQVHPAFLYESLWNAGCLVILLILTLRKQGKHYDGEIFLLYLALYGLGRSWIEGLRTDQLLLPGMDIPVSQVVSGILVVTAGAVLLVRWIRRNKGGTYGSQ